MSCVGIPQQKVNFPSPEANSRAQTTGPPLVGALSAPMDVSAGVVVAWYGCSWAGHWVVRPPGTLVGFRWSLHHREWLGGWFWSGHPGVSCSMDVEGPISQYPVWRIKNDYDYIYVYVYKYDIYRFAYTSCKHYAANRRCCSKSGWCSSNYSFCIVLVMIASDSCSCYNSRHSMY